MSLEEVLLIGFASGALFGFSLGGIAYYWIGRNSGYLRAMRKASA